jgi:chromosomal replication initiation ATPase DnaA
MKSEYFVFKRGDSVTLGGKKFTVKEIEHTHDGLKATATPYDNPQGEEVIIRSIPQETRVFKVHTYKQDQVDRIIDAVSEYFIISRKDLTSKNRSRHNILARTTATILLDDIGVHNVVIGKLLNTHRTNVIYFLKKREDLKMRDREVFNAYNNLKATLDEKKETVLR